MGDKPYRYTLKRWPRLISSLEGLRTLTIDLGGITHIASLSVRYEDLREIPLGLRHLDLRFHLSPSSFFSDQSPKTKSSYASTSQAPSEINPWVRSRVLERLVGLETFRVYGDHRLGQEKDLKLPQSLKTFWLSTPHPSPGNFQIIMPPHITELFIDIATNFSENWYSSLPQSLEILGLPSVRALRKSKEFLQRLTRLTDLNLEHCGDLSLEWASSLPPSVKRLKTISINKWDFLRLPSFIPHLSLVDKNINELKASALPSRLESLFLRNPAALFDAESLNVWPPGLTNLSLSVGNTFKIEYMSLLPPSLESLWFGNYGVLEEEVHRLPRQLKRITMYLSISAKSAPQLPPNLSELDTNHALCDPKALLLLPKSLRFLRTTLPTSDPIPYLEIPHGITSLHLTATSSTVTSILLPSSLTSLELLGMDLGRRQIQPSSPEGFLPPNLRHIAFAMSETNDKEIFKAMPEELSSLEITCKQPLLASDLQNLPRRLKTISATFTWTADLIPHLPPHITSLEGYMEDVDELCEILPEVNLRQMKRW
jgi:hypothetical protein